MAREKKFTVSVIMSVYNEEHFLNESIQSVLSQSLKEFELIIVNDASTDKSLSIIKRFSKKDSRIKIINNKINMGRSASRNKALAIAKGKYVAIFDADDVCLKTRLAEEVNYLESNPRTYLVGSGAINIDEGGKELSKYYPITNKEKLVNNLKKRDCLYHPTIMFRNTKEYYYREEFTFAEDHDFYLRIISDKKEIGAIHTPLIKYRIRDNTKTLKRSIQQTLFSLAAIKFFNEREKKGKDSYNTFRAKSITGIDVESDESKEILGLKVIFYLREGDKKKARELCLKYSKKYGLRINSTLWYAFSLMPKSIATLIRKARVTLINLI